MKVWTYPLPNGGVGVVSIDQASLSKGNMTDAQWEAFCLRKQRGMLPPGTVLTPMDSSDLPADRSRRNHWVIQGNRVAASPVDLPPLP